MRTCFTLLILICLPVLLPGTISARASVTQQPDTAQVSALVQRGKALVYEYPDSARAYFEQALPLAERSGSATHHATALNWIGVAHYILGEYNDALPYFTRALRLSEDANDHNGIAASLNHIGLIYEIQGQHDRAIEQHKNAIVHAEAINNTERLASNHFNIGLIYDETGRYDEALTYLTKALQLSEDHQHYRLVAMSYNRLGEIHFHLGKLSDAETYYSKVLTYPHYQSNWETCFAQAGLAQVFLASGNTEESIVRGKEAYRLALAMQAKWEIIRASDILSLAYADKKDFQQAYAMQRIARQVSDSVFNEEKEKELNYIHLQENELQKLRLRQQNELQQAELRYKNLYIILGGIVLLSLLVISFTLYTRQRQKVRLNRELSDINERIEFQNRQLHSLNLTKNNLLSIIGHDMRSPLVNLSALLSLIRQDDLDPETQQKFLAELQVSVDAVSGTLDNLLHWATSQMEGFETKPVVIDLDDILEGKISFWQHAIRKKNITIRHRKQGLNALADLDQVRTVMRNIVGNAIKFTHAGGEISISYRDHAGMVGTVITDTGIGMTEDRLKELFAFRPGKHTRGTDNEKGSGLGLMISNQFVEKNNGKMRVESTPGKGTTFTIWLPKAPG
jgi:signal transduction histidine kinase